MREGEMSIIFTARLTQVLFFCYFCCCCCCCLRLLRELLCSSYSPPPPRGVEKKERKGTVAVVERCEFSCAPTGPSSVSGQWALWAVGCGEDIEQKEE